MATMKATPYRKPFILLVDSKMRKIDLEKLRQRIGVWLAARPVPRAGGCRTIQGPGGVVLCEGDCRKAGEECAPKRQPGGSYKCVCQRRIAL